MKKITLLLIAVLSTLGVQAQSDYYTVLLNNNGVSQNGRAPQSARAVSRTVWIITADEMAEAGFAAGDVINSLGFTYTTPQAPQVDFPEIETTGNIIIYMQNTADVTNTKSTTYATAIAGMTTVSNGSVTLPMTASPLDIPFAGGSPFTYTGGSLYIAFDYQNLSGTLSTFPNTVSCNNTLAASLLGAMSAGVTTVAPTTLAVSAFRPETRLGKAVTCARPTNLDITNNTLNSADATFDVTAGGTVELEYGPFGFTQGFDGTVVTGVTSPYTISGLDPSYVYDYYVRKDCGGADQSAWSGPFPFNTIFQPADTDYNTSFLQLTLPFIGWSADPDNSATGWFINAGLSQDGDDACAAVISSATAAGTENLYSRGLNLNGGATVTVNYWVRNFVQVSTNAASYVLTAGQGMDDFAQSIPVASESGITSATYVEKTFSFVAPTTGVYFLRFKHTSPANTTPNSLHAFLLDNLTVTQSLGVNEQLSSQFAVYPNPVKNVVNISNTTNAVVSLVEMTDLNGRVVKTQAMNATSGQVSIADLASGIYMMNITTDKGKAVKKIVKE